MTQTRCIKHVPTILMILFFCPMLSTAQTYVLQSSVFGSGGRSMTGSTYSVVGTVGQSSPVGISSGSTYTTYHGFWHAIGGGGGVLDAMILAIELLNPNTARLSWVAVTGATIYDLYRNTSPYFSTGGMPWQTVSSPSVQYDFSDGIGDGSVNYYFKGKARNASQQSPESNTVGEFDFDSDGSSAIKIRIIATD